MIFQGIEAPSMPSAWKKARSSWFWNMTPLTPPRASRYIPLTIRLTMPDLKPAASPCRVEPRPQIRAWRRDTPASRAAIVPKVTGFTS